MLFRISGADAEVEKCPQAGAGLTNCQCSVSVSTNVNTILTVTGNNPFSPGVITDFGVDIPCNCDATNSSLYVVVRGNFQIFIPGEFREGSISTVCDANGITAQGEVILGGAAYIVNIRANRNGTVTATFEGASVFTITLSGADVVIGNCI